MSPEQLGYIALAATVIGLVVRLLKEDVAFLPTVPSKWRPALALGLGLVAGVLEIAAKGTPWKEAILGGVAAAATAIVGHNVVIDSVRGGRELGQTKLVDPSDAPTAPVLPKDPPSVPAILFLVGCAIFGARVVVGCAAAAESTYTAQQLQCVDRAHTLEESKACRAEVDRAWHVVDGGVQ